MDTYIYMYCSHVLQAEVHVCVCVRMASLPNHQLLISVK